MMPTCGSSDNFPSDFAHDYGLLKGMMHDGMTTTSIPLLLQIEIVVAMLYQA